MEPSHSGMLNTAIPTILTVDDAPENLAILSDLLRPAYRVLAATSGERALRIAGSLARRQDLDQAGESTWRRAMPAKSSKPCKNTSAASGSK